MSHKPSREDCQQVSWLRIFTTDSFLRLSMSDLCRLDEGGVPFGVAVKVETLVALLLLFVRFRFSVDDHTTSRTFPGGALIKIEV
jgi:hypothetical protein